jgi:2-keto-4-pentenoate hydratase
MLDHDFDAARAALLKARRDATPLPDLPAAWVPPDLDTAMRLQRAVAVALGPTRGWKVSAVTPEGQRALGVDGPIAGPLLAPFLVESGATLRRGQFVHPKVECEFAFVLARALPPRATPWTRAEVAAAVGAMRIGIELVDSRLPASAGTLSQLADGLNNGAYVVGPATRDWATVRWADTPIVLHRRTADGTTTEVARGDGRAILDGDPFGAVVLLANASALAQRGLAAGDLVTTGSCTGAPELPGAGDYEADFGALGRVSVRIEA